LAVIFKILERLVTHQLVTYLDAVANCLLPSSQSAEAREGTQQKLQPGICVHLDLDAVDRDDSVMLVLLKLSVAFDTVDHGILLERLQMPCSLGVYMQSPIHRTIRPKVDIPLFGG